MRLVHILPLPLLALVSVLSAHVGAEPFFNAPPLSDDELQQARGGFKLSNGLNIDFGVRISTRVDGLSVMQTEMRIAGDEMRTQIINSTGQKIEFDKDGQQIAIFADNAQAELGPVSGEASHEGAQAQAGGVAGQVSPSGAQAQIGSMQLSAGQGGASVQFPSIHVNTSAGAEPQPESATPAPQQIASDSSPVGQTIVRISDAGVLATTELPDLLVRHAIGREISSMIVNTANGRVVDNEVSINLQMNDVQPFALGSVGYRVQSLGLEAGMWRAIGG